ncbi:hypothetical protein [Ferrovibrio sp.]|jgi:hypothetical protein|uniref:hypothetical protein n=1 Tax=Ferrovibrio sp. TaxID=1917215 RepID=UPI0035B3363F
MTSTAFTFFAAALLAAAPALVQPALAQPYNGEYRGSLEDRGRPVVVILSLETAKAPGDAGGRIRFQEPWVCGFELEYSGIREKAAVYSFKGSGAGACRPYTQGYARVQSDGANLQLELVGADRGASQKIQLQPAQKRD